jgi:hypothetical protein
MHAKLITTVLAVLLAVLLLGTVGSFLYVVSVFTLLSVSTVVLALMLMFGLGMMAGGRRIRITRLRQWVKPPSHSFGD